MLSDGTHTYAYDAENRITKVDNGNTATYVYDAFGRRVAKNTASPQNNECTTSSYGQVFYVYDLSDHYEVYTGTGVNGCIDEIYAGSRHLATYTQGVTNFSHSDWLGTERVRNTYGSTTAQYCTSNPFGDALSCSPIGYESPLHFTGKLRDYESNLSNFGARYDSTTIGRFMSPDPVTQSKQKLRDPQQWNMFAYARNNPLRFLDPTGMYVCQGTRQECQKIEDALAKAREALNTNKNLTANEKKQLKRVTDFFGKAGDQQDGITIHFGSSSTPLGTSSSKEEGVFTTTITVDSGKIAGLNSAGLGEALVHEGQHGLDGIARGGKDPQNKQEELRTERNAYGAQSEVPKGLAVKSPWLTWDPNWSSGIAEAERRMNVERDAQASTAIWCGEGGNCQ